MVCSGVYRFVRHPIYLGYLVTHVGFVIAYPAGWNLAVLLAAVHVRPGLAAIIGFVTGLIADSLTPLTFGPYIFGRAVDEAESCVDRLLDERFAAQQNRAQFRHRGAVVNVIPPQYAGQIARDSGLANQTGWCPIDPATFESRQVPGIHVVGDATIEAIADAMVESRGLTIKSTKLLRR